MPIDLIEEAGGKLISVSVSGTLTKSDYERFGPEVERLIKQFGKIDIVLTMHDFHGWDGRALWEDIKFNFKHFRDIRRLAFVGETKWEKWMAAFCAPFTTAEIKYFDQGQAAQAREWIYGLPTHTGAHIAHKPAADLHAKHAVFGIYGNRIAAEKAIEQLKHDGFKADEVSVLAPHQKVVRLIQPAENVAFEDTAMGAMIGGVLGWVAGITLIAIPGFGAAFIGGPIVWAFLSLGTLSGAGGIIGGLFGLGLSDAQSKHYESRLHKGDILLSIHCDDAERTMKAKDVLIHTGAEDVYARPSRISTR
jgi:hypothetical protein